MPVFITGLVLAGLTSGIFGVISGLALTGTIGVIFCLWGIKTPAGRRRFDEMDGIYPYLGGLGGGVLLAIAGVLALFWT